MTLQTFKTRSMLCIWGTVFTWTQDLTIRLRVDSKSIQIIAGEGPTKSFIDAKGLTTAVILSGYPNQTRISGFTILNGIGDLNADGNSGGIRVEPGVKASIDNCVLTGHEDGAIFFGDSETIVTNTLTYGNDDR